MALNVRITFLSPSKRQCQRQYDERNRRINASRKNKHGESQQCKLQQICVAYTHAHTNFQPIPPLNITNDEHILGHFTIAMTYFFRQFHQSASLKFLGLYSR